MRRPLGLVAAAFASVLVLGACGATGGSPPEHAPDPGVAHEGAGGPGAGDDAGGGAAASCVLGLTYEGAFYLGVDSGRVTAGEELDGAEVPPCNDTGGTGGQEESGSPIDAFAIEGVDPRYAVMAEGGAGPMTFVAERYAPGMRDAEPLPRDVAQKLGLS